MGRKPNWQIMDECDASQLPGSKGEAWLMIIKTILGGIGILFLLSLGSRWM